MRDVAPTLRLPPENRTATIVPATPLRHRPAVFASVNIPRAALAACLALGTGLVVAASLAAAPAIELSIADLQAPGFAAKGVRVELDGKDFARLRVHIDEVMALDRRWRDIEISCAAFHFDRSAVSCDDGRLERPAVLPIAFRHEIASGDTRLVVSPGGEERWTIEVSGGDPRRIVVRAAAVPAARLHFLAPELPVAISGGGVDGTLRAEISGSGDTHVAAELTLRAGAFADQAGLHAGEGLGGRLTLDAGGRDDDWRWRVGAEWTQGEVFWTPVYSKAGFRLTAEGAYGPRTVDVTRATLQVDEVGDIHVSARVDRQSQGVLDAQVETGELAVTTLYARFLQPALAQTALGDLRTEGRLHASLRWREGRLTNAVLDLDDVSAEDRRGRFALFGVYASLPWRADARTEGRIGLSGAEVQRLPLGAVGMFLDIRSDEVVADDFTIPVLSGLLALRDLRVRREPGGVAWRVRGALSPVPLAELLAHFGLPAMQGTLAGEIPLVRYERSTLAVDGALTLRVFDGTVKVTDLVVDDPLGLAPRLSADLDARELDLALMTRAFSFGSITGRVDARISDLVLSNWKPVRFDARLESSPGDYSRRISQTAVENISALGGAGATAAIQRSVLRFFESFGYSKLGISCRLRDDVCRMGGIEDAPQGFVLVRGGGLPAITVLGYNRNVGWDELLARLRRVVDSNVTPTIR